MKENYELMEHIYKDAEMAVYTLTTLTNDLKDKDNKISREINHMLHFFIKSSFLPIDIL